MKLSVVIINYKTADLTSDCLKSLLPEMQDVDGQIVVVDNNSGDDSVDVLRKWLMQHDTGHIVKLVESPINSGFSGGNNLGIQALDADYYLLLNSDTIVCPGAITTLLQTADAHPEAGLVSPRLLSLDGQPQVSCFRFHTPISEFIDAVRTGPITKFLKKYDVPVAVSDEAAHPQWTSFACVLVRDKLFREIGLLDDGFFMYFEDAEFCFRARKAHAQIVHTPSAEVIHLHGESSGLAEIIEQKRRLPKYYYASRTRYFYLLYGRSGLLMANVLWSIGRIGSKFREFLERRQSHVPQKQWRDIWINWLRPLAGETGRP